MGSVDYKIDWHSEGTGIAKSGELIVQDRQHYFDMLRRFLQELKNIGSDQVDKVFVKYNVHFIDIDEFKRVNIDEPIQGA